MKKFAILILSILIAGLFVACNQDITVDAQTYANMELGTFVLNGKNYATLQAAVDAIGSKAAGDNVIYLTRHASGPGAKIANKDVTIDFQGYTYSFTNVNGLQGQDVTGKDFGLSITSGSDVVLKGLQKIDLNDKTTTDLTMVYVEGATTSLTIEDAPKMKVEPDQYVFWAADGATLTIGSTTTTTEKTEITGKIAATGTSEKKPVVSFNNDTTINASELKADSAVVVINTSTASTIGSFVGANDANIVVSGTGDVTVTKNNSESTATYTIENTSSASGTETPSTVIVPTTDGTERKIDAGDKVEDDSTVIEESTSVARIGSILYTKFYDPDDQENSAYHKASSTSIDTIVLLKDITINYVDIFKSVTIDGNGHSVTSTNTDRWTRGNAFSVNTDRFVSERMNVTFKNLLLNSAGVYAIYGEGNIQLDIDNMTINTVGLGVYIDGYDVGVVNVSNTIVSSTNTVPSSAGWLNAGFSVGVNGILNANNCTINALNSIYVYSSGGIITVNGGNYIGKIQALVDLNTYPEAVGGFEIEDGVFEGELIVTSPAYMSITGGTFDHDPSAYVAPGYVANKIDESTWEVIPDTPQVSILKDGDPASKAVTMSLASFRDKVNAGETYAGYTVTLLADVDLGNVEWTPIGTSENPFSGVFDGQNHTISNYTVVTPNDKSGTGLFKMVVGQENSGFNSLNNVYDLETYVFNDNSIGESDYTCVIKNLKLCKVTTTASDGVSNSRFTAGLVGISKNAYISNIEVSDSTINVFKYGAAIVGSMSGTVIDNARVLSDVKVVGTGSNAGHIAGIVGESGNSQGTRINAIVNTINNATITGYYGNIGGISAMGKGTVFYNCVNNGQVNITGGTECGGIDGNADASYFIKCTNNGPIIAVNATGGSGGIGGICGYHQNAGIAVFHDCYNYGNISNTGTSKLAGIAVSGALSNSFYRVANYGTLFGSSAVAIYDISGSAGLNLTINESTSFSNLQTTLNNSNPASVNITAEITGDLGEIVLPSNVKTIVATSKIANSYNLSGLVGNSLTINMPGEYQLKNIGNKSIYVIGAENVIIDQSEQSTASITLGGSSCKLTNNGILNKVSFYGTSDSDSYILVNNRTISHTKDNNTSHTVSSITVGNITIHNYGTIEAKKGSYSNSDYALLFYNGSSISIYCYNDSTVSTDGNSLFAATNSTTGTIYYQSGCKFVIGSSKYNYPPIISPPITIEQLNSN